MIKDYRWGQEEVSICILQTKTTGGDRRKYLHTTNDQRLQVGTGGSIDLHTTNDLRLQVGTGGSICILQTIKDYRWDRRKYLHTTNDQRLHVGTGEVFAYYKRSKTTCGDRRNICILQVIQDQRWEQPLRMISGLGTDTVWECSTTYFAWC